MVIGPKETTNHSPNVLIIYKQKKNMAGEVVVDALPYFDRGYDEPGVREAVSVL